MRYVSTRGEAPVLNFEEVVLTGLARDGGLYVPETWPQMSKDDIRALAGMSYADAAAVILQPFLGDCISKEDFREMTRKAYGTFAHKAVVPLSQLGPNDFLMELYHGPTLAFKDVALQLLGLLYDHLLGKQGKKVTIVGATSGDTGSAAIEACRGRDAVDIFILHPAGRVSEVQRRQMTTVLDSNVHNIAVEGDFDDCQAMVKAMFNDHDFRDRLAVSAVNSINWARVMAQIVYYFTAAVSLGGPDRPVSFSVPSGNFGDVYAGYAASRMGLPIDQLLVATNRNDILSRFFNTGEYRKASVEPTISPSMDIQVSSNFERFLFDLEGREGAQVKQLMADLDTEGGFAVELSRLNDCIFGAGMCDEKTTLETIRQTLKDSAKLVDPHTAVGLHVADTARKDEKAPMVTLSTAHPAKFPAAVKEATGVHPDLPDHMADLFEREERMVTLPNELEAVKSHIVKNARILETN
ncbi:threonine synthase [Sneathiella chinensis]|uniref:Threonine synthase n=1 Tax=Sneathiella chinensis TaxID=349750 RepID=A0ABQ5U0J4_9PROT|nr:threonine synthase [Sneathiella chinensis]GLQ05674.1 threonine synthase [Sneathiella chinensis]